MLITYPLSVIVVRKSLRWNQVMRWSWWLRSDVVVDYRPVYVSKERQWKICTQTWKSLPTDEISALTWLNDNYAEWQPCANKAPDEKLRSDSEEHSSRALGRLKIYISRRRLPSSKQILIMGTFSQSLLHVCLLCGCHKSSALVQHPNELEFDFLLKLTHTLTHLKLLLKRMQNEKLDFEMLHRNFWWMLSWWKGIAERCCVCCAFQELQIKLKTENRSCWSLSCFSRDSETQASDTTLSI